MKFDDAVFPTCMVSNLSLFVSRVGLCPIYVKWCTLAEHRTVEPFTYWGLACSVVYYYHCLWHTAVWWCEHVFIQPPFLRSSPECTVQHRFLQPHEKLAFRPCSDIVQWCFLYCRNQCSCSSVVVSSACGLSLFHIVVSNNVLAWPIRLRRGLNSSDMAVISLTHQTSFLAIDCNRL